MNNVPLFRFALAGVMATLSSPALADAPKVVTDIAPIHGLVARVMDGVGTPDVLLPPGASAHHYSMRPSDARAVQNADIVIWTDPYLSPWLGETLEGIAPDTEQVVLGGVEGTLQLPFRESAVFDLHDHDEDEHDHDEHAHDGHDHDEDHDHDDHEDHDHDDDHDHDHEAHDDHDHDDAHDHDHDHEDAEHADDHDEHEHDDHDDAHEHDHVHGPYDPHLWLSPDNAILWLDVIAQELAEIDPENAETYRANAQAGQGEIADAVDAVAARIDALDDVRFVVFHDAYRYFEDRFGIEAVGAISISDASAPSPKRLSEVRDAVKDAGVNCAFSEPQFSPKLVDAVTDGLDVTKAVLDPLGSDIALGSTFYVELLESFATAFESCE
ncbi:zinc ABC transporter substrate-binding protein [Celeribacter sp.]|uniref:zinc ABC transporter substrate-binding protein n=1 Tax=Celeribacter sp. TaxID=1890673 RepID=UPI003A91D76E